MKKFHGNSDSVLIFTKNDIHDDTVWGSFTFAKPGLWVFSVTANLQGGDKRTGSGDVNIYSKNLSAVIVPADQAKIVGEASSLTVTATGDAPFTYQWYHGTLVLSETNITLVKASLALSDSGIYTCLVTDKWGDTATSGIAQIHVSTAANGFSANITPAVDTKQVDSTAIFTVTAVGDTPFTYKWLHGSAIVGGQTNAVLKLTAVALADSGVYSCIVKNPKGDSVTTNTAVLHVIPNSIGNSKPVISLVKGFSKILATEICTLVVTATDPDVGQTHSFTIAKAPKSKYTFVDSTFIWAPPAGYLGTDSVKMHNIAPFGT